MAEAILTVVLVAVVGSLSVPTAMLLLARLGYFEPIRFEMFGRRWSFAPQPTVVTAYSNATFATFPPRQTVFAGAAAAVLTVRAENISPVQHSVNTRSSATGLALDVR